MSTTNVETHDSTEPPSTAALVGRDRRGREHRYDYHAQAMWVRVDGGWAVGPCSDLEAWHDELAATVGWREWHVATERTVDWLAEQVVGGVSDD